MGRVKESLKERGNGMELGREAEGSSEGKGRGKRRLYEDICKIS
jgi:hypothetical protein